MELVLHSHYESADPFTFICKAWATLCAIEEFTEETSDFDWGSAGLLPVLRCDGQVYTRSHVIDFLKLAYDLNKDLESNERLEAALLEELVYSQLHPATQHAVWVEGHKVRLDRSFIGKVVSWPYETYKHLTTKASVKDALFHQHSIKSPGSALYNADLVHQKLSERLGSRTFFFSKPGRPEHPRSTDIIVAAFLNEERTHLANHPHYAESLTKYPNLIAFMNLINKICYERSNRSPSANPALGHLFVSTPQYPEVAAYYPPQIHFYKESLASSKHFSYISGLPRPALKTGDIVQQKRRIYVTGVAGVLFSFFLLKTHLA
mmetsp:Transcript_7322/g.13546  ORF Transcript_7322/g.13546 Transcript_7322/m.13546 type:complete len:320 (+) Transcript_7322:697-1656(+)